MGRTAKATTALGERLQSLREGKSRSEFAAFIGVHENTLGGYERGERNPDWSFLTQLREKTGADLNWLVSGNQSIIGGDQIPDGFVPIPRMEVRASAGNGRVAIMNDAEAQVVAFKEEWLRRLGVSPRNATIIVADGDSMADTIGHGDLVLLDRSIDHVVDNGIYVLVYGGMVLLKRVQVKRNGVVLLKSDNPRYETEEIQSHEVPELIIEGRVRWAGGAL